MNIAALGLAGCTLLLAQAATARLAAEERSSYVQAFMTRCLAIHQQGLAPASANTAPRQTQINAYCQCGADRSADELTPGMLSSGHQGKREFSPNLRSVMEKVREDCLARFPES